MSLVHQKLLELKKCFFSSSVLVVNTQDLAILALVFACAVGCLEMREKNISYLNSEREREREREARRVVFHFYFIFIFEETKKGVVFFFFFFGCGKKNKWVFYFYLFFNEASRGG